jgi:hypothetical protein
MLRNGKYIKRTEQAQLTERLEYRAHTHTRGRNSSPLFYILSTFKFIISHELQKTIEWAFLRFWYLCGATTTSLGSSSPTFFGKCVLRRGWKDSAAAGNGDLAIMVTAASIVVHVHAVPDGGLCVVHGRYSFVQRE